MKKNLSFAIIAMSILGLGGLTSCQDEDLDVSNAVLQERAFEQGFIKEFGKPSADQRWDFYAQKMEKLFGSTTRATMAEDPVCTVTTGVEQKYDIALIQDIVNTKLPAGVDNSNQGQNTYTLRSVGKFKISAVNYGGNVETLDSWKFHFGISYRKANGQRVNKELFSTQTIRQEMSYYTVPGSNPPRYYGNPELAAEVELTYNTPFSFYMEYTRPNEQDHWIFYSDEKPDPNGGSISSSTGRADGDKYEGPSTLLYSLEDLTEDGTQEQIIVLGFEDIWFPGGSSDRDFNDVVLFIEGTLPIASSKRFFSEDLESFDYDYNDVVFDLTSSGIVLRAVGGTLPVYLKILPKGGNPENENDWVTTGELHEVMHVGNGNAKAEHKTFKLGDKTLYSPINVGDAKYGVKLEAVRIPGIEWTGDKWLTADDVTNFANSLSDSKVGDVKLLVGNPAEVLDKVDSTDGIIEYQDVGGVPAIWWGPVDINWMKELKKISLGYEYFYGGAPEGGSYWYEGGKHPEYWYVFGAGDVGGDKW